MMAKYSNYSQLTKKLLLIIIVFFGNFSFSQEYKIPLINFDQEIATQNEYIKVLKLEDKNALIIKESYYSFWTKGIAAHFLVFQNDGKVLKYEAFFPSQKKFEIKIKNQKLNQKKIKPYWQFLNECVANDRFKIQKEKLNIIEKPIGDSIVETRNFTEGLTYEIEIVQNNKQLKYSSYAPKSYIEDEYPGFEERIKLVTLLKDIENLRKKY
jgi:hypothetical protein